MMLSSYLVRNIIGDEDDFAAGCFRENILKVRSCCYNSPIICVIDTLLSNSIRNISVVGLAVQ